MSLKIIKNGLWIQEAKENPFDAIALAKQVEDLINQERSENKEIIFHTSEEGARQLEESLVQYVDPVQPTEFGIHINHERSEVSLRNSLYMQLQNGDITPIEYLDKISEI